MGYETITETVTYSFEISVYHVAGVEVAEALGNIAKLARALCVG